MRHKALGVCLGGSTSAALALALASWRISKTSVAVLYTSLWCPRGAEQQEQQVVDEGERFALVVLSARLSLSVHRAAAAQWKSEKVHCSE